MRALLYVRLGGGRLAIDGQGKPLRRLNVYVQFGSLLNSVRRTKVTQCDAMRCDSCLVRFIGVGVGVGEM